jgi:serine beta-lactamase-like protein LACTB, mitochondrial
MLLINLLHKRLIRCRYYFIVAGLGICATFKCYAQSPTITDKDIVFIDSVVAVYMSRNSVPGASLAIIKNSKIVLKRGYGMANLELFVPATPSTIYRLASVSKPITAVAVMQLVEQGKIDLDAPIQKYVPSFPEKPHPLTTRQLLAHLSGIRHYKTGESKSNKPYKSLTEALEIFKNDSLMHLPGDRQTYSTYGYTLLGVIIENVSGKSYVNYLQEHIFKPAGMIHTYADDPFKIIQNRSAPYDTIISNTVGNSIAVNTSYKIPGGGLVSNVEDMSLFIIALQLNRLVKPETWQRMITEVTTRRGDSTNYGFGWELGLPAIEGLPPQPSAIWHGGVQQGSSTAVVMLPHRDIGVVVLSNLGGLGKEMTILIRRIVAYFSNHE